LQYLSVRAWYDQGMKRTKPEIQMTQAEADAYMETFKQNVGKVLSVSKDDFLKADAATKKKRAKAKKLKT
jgi:hypothetical protein